MCTKASNTEPRSGNGILLLLLIGLVAASAGGACAAALNAGQTRMLLAQADGLYPMGCVVVDHGSADVWLEACLVDPVRTGNASAPVPTVRSAGFLGYATKLGLADLPPPAA